jgi:ribosomal protein S18 acetylase RimI-like enzyme
MPGYYPCVTDPQLSTVETRPDWTFRTATSAEAGTIATIVNAAYRVEDFFINGNRTDHGEILGALQEHAFLVAEDRGGELVGAVEVEIRGDRGYFGMLSVRPGMQGSGLGRRLISEVESHCRERGCRWLDLMVVNLREELLPWYGRLGFRETGTAPFPDPAKLKRACHMVLMEKALT